MKDLIHEAFLTMRPEHEALAALADRIADGSEVGKPGQEQGSAHTINKRSPQSLTTINNSKQKDVLPYPK